MTLRIANYLGHCPWGQIDGPAALQRGLGGRETALIRLTEAWSDAGHEVQSFVPTDQIVRTQKQSGGLSAYVPHQVARAQLGAIGCDVLVSWEEPRVFAAPEVRESIGLGLVEMQVAHLSVEDPDTGDSIDPDIDGYLVLSQWAGKFLAANEKRIDPDKIAVLPNCCDISMFDRAEVGHPGPGPYKFLYASSPDRGLAGLAQAWPLIESRFPGSRLRVAYGVEDWLKQARWSHNSQSVAALEVESLLTMESVDYAGRIGQADLAGLHLDSDALLYPCDTMSPTETGCITVVEAMAACSPALITDCDCLGSEFGSAADISPLPYDPVDYACRVEAVMDDPALYEALQLNGRQLAEGRDWDLVAQRWLDYFDSRLSVK